MALIPKWSPGMKCVIKKEKRQFKVMKLTKQSFFQSINTITEEFKINKEYLREDFNSFQNKERREWFLDFDNQVKDKIREEWYHDMDKFMINIPFFTWFELYCQKHDVNNPYNLTYIQTQTQLTKNWTMIDGRTVTSVHPPPSAFKFKKGEKELEAAPYKTGREEYKNQTVIVEDILKIYQQNNYSNQILQTIATQVDHVSTKIDNKLSKDISSLSKDTSSKLIKTQNFPNQLSYPHFKPHSLPFPVASKLAKASEASTSSSAETLNKRVNVIKRNLSL